MNWKRLLIATMALGLVTAASAQRGQGRPAGSQAGTQARGSAAGSQAAGGQGTQAQTRQQQIRAQATTQQREQFQSSTQASNRLQKRVRQMARISSTQPISAEQAYQWREQLRTETLLTTQEQERLLNELSETQQAAVQDHTQKINDGRNRLEELSDALERELALESPDVVQVKQQAQEMTTAVNEVRNQQKAIGTDLGLEE